MQPAKGEMLVAAPERWDEACFSLPAVRAVRSSGLVTGVLCLEEQVELWRALPGISVIPFTGGKGAKRTAAEMRGHWQAAILWERGVAAEMCQRAAIPRRIGPATKSLKKFVTHPIGSGETPGPTKHRVTFYLAVVSQLGMRVDLPELFLPVMEPQTVPRSVLLGPDSELGPSHLWPVEYWREIGTRLHQAGWKITIAAPQGGSKIARGLVDSIDCETRFFEATPLAAALPVLGSHELVVAADGFLPHAAAMAGTTCVTLFGPGDPVWKRPLGTRHATAWQHVECAPCLEKKCPLDLRCQRELNVDAVWRAIVSCFPTLL